MNLRKVDFFWINREQRSFEWFISLLSQLEIEQAEQGGAMERFLDMHMYITSALQKTDMKAVGLQLALELLHEKVMSLQRVPGVLLPYRVTSHHCHPSTELLAHIFVCWAALSILCWIFDIPIQSCCHEARQIPSQ